jgi:hypothetical protein
MEDVQVERRKTRRTHVEVELPPIISLHESRTAQKTDQLDLCIDNLKINSCDNSSTTATTATMID